MTKNMIGFLAAIGLAACTDVAGETDGTFTYRGETFPSVIRQFDTPNGRFSKRYIYSRPHPVSCSVTDDRDCEAAILISRTRATNR